MKRQVDFMRSTSLRLLTEPFEVLQLFIVNIFRLQKHLYKRENIFRQACCWPDFTETIHQSCLATFFENLSRSSRYHGIRSIHRPYRRGYVYMSKICLRYKQLIIPSCKARTQQADCSPCRHPKFQIPRCHQRANSFLTKDSPIANPLPTFSSPAKYWAGNTRPAPSSRAAYPVEASQQAISMDVGFLEWKRWTAVIWLIADYLGSQSWGGATSLAVVGVVRTRALDAI